LSKAQAGFGVTAIADLVVKVMRFSGSKQTMETQVTLTSEPVKKNFLKAERVDQPFRKTKNS
jgi:hypothetical protein